MASRSCFLNELKEGTFFQIDVIVCRKWDAYNFYGKYKGTDYVLSDAKGNVIHCTTKSTVAHCFMGKLKEGYVFTFKDFHVLPNLKEYCVVRSSRYMIELHGSSVVRRHESVPDGFCRYPFALTDIGDIKFDIHDTALIDVMGYVVDVGPVVPKTVFKGQKLKKPSQALDFYLVGKRGHKIRVSLWGDLADEFLQRKPSGIQSYAVILVGLSVRTYKDTFLSSTSSTLLFDAEEIPQLADFRKVEMHAEAVEVPPAQVTLLELSQWSKAKKKATNFHCYLRITGVDTTSPWYYFACTSGRCMKGVTRRNGGFYCEACESRIEFPRARFKIRLTVEDKTHSAAVTLFDSVAESLLSTSVDALLAGQDADDAGGVPPEVVLNLVDSWHLFEIPSQTYYPHGGEGYTCVGITPGKALRSDDTAGSQSNKIAGLQGTRRNGPGGASKDVVNGVEDEAASAEKDLRTSGHRDGGGTSSSTVGDTASSGDNLDVDDQSSAKCRKRKNVVSSDDDQAP